MRSIRGHKEITTPDVEWPGTAWEIKLNSEFEAIKWRAPLSEPQIGLLLLLKLDYQSLYYNSLYKNCHLSRSYDMPFGCRGCQRRKATGMHWGEKRRTIVMIRFVENSIVNEYLQPTWNSVEQYFCLSLPRSGTMARFLSTSISLSIRVCLLRHGSLALRHCIDTWLLKV